MSDAQRRPPAPFAMPPLTRRSVLATGAAGLAAVYGLSGCGDDADDSSGGGGGGAEKASGTVSFGSNYSDPVPKKALQTVFDEFTTSSSVKVDVNTVDHNTFQEQINNYLQGTPDDVFTWFAGYRMQFFAQRGLAGDISDVWEKIGGNMLGRLQAGVDASTASSTSCRSTTTRGPSSTARACSRRTATSRPRTSTSSKH